MNDEKAAFTALRRGERRTKSFAAISAPFRISSFVIFHSSLVLSLGFTLIETRLI